jgi:hypothetical protein
MWLAEKLDWKGLKSTTNNKDKFSQHDFIIKIILGVEN